MPRSARGCAPGGAGQQGSGGSLSRGRRYRVRARPHPRAVRAVATCKTMKTSARKRQSWRPYGPLCFGPVKAIRRFSVRTVLPEPIAALGDLASNLRWSWHPPTRDLFAEIDPKRWAKVRKDPVGLLSALSARRARRARRRRGFVARVARRRRGPADLPAPSRAGTRAWAATVEGGAPASIAYFCPEFGITEVLPQYSGGLGILAGDHLKSASDLGVPDRRRRPVLQDRLLQAVAVPRRLAAGDLPGARPGRAAAVPAARGRRHALPGHRRPARRPHPGGARLEGPGRPRAAAAARLRRARPTTTRPAASPTGCTAAAASTGCSRRCCSASAASARCGCGRG